VPKLAAKAALSRLARHSKLEAGKDHTETRPKILCYTTPLSMAGTPVVTMPFPGGAGVQLAAPRGKDARLLAYVAAIASERKE
jgi:aspartyl-tRNA(Asn)/glutamyl-tRNA(Gln) amidotransferase subunit A